MEMVREDQRIELHLDVGTAYDLFASLGVLHQPEKFGLRASWAAGVRSRLPSGDRKTLEDAQDVNFAPLAWLGSLDGPKDCASVLWELANMPASRRLEVLSFSNHQKKEAFEILNSVKQRHSWNEEDLNRLRSTLPEHHPLPRHQTLNTLLDLWSNPEQFGEMYLAALQSYYSVFFQEEEMRLRPLLKEAAERAEEMADSMSLDQLLEQLSHGILFPTFTDLREMILAPSYWITPLIIYEPPKDGRSILLFGARPPENSLVPGEVVPETLLSALKALSDPTRLQILRYLVEQPLTPSQLARKLRLRAPTIIHHLNALRLAGLIHFSLETEGERRYAIRAEAVRLTFAALQKFLGKDKLL